MGLVIVVASLRGPVVSMDVYFGQCASCHGKICLHLVRGCFWQVNTGVVAVRRRMRMESILGSQ